MSQLTMHAAVLHVRTAPSTSFAQRWSGSLIARPMRKCVVLSGSISFRVPSRVDSQRYHLLARSMASVPAGPGPCRRSCPAPGEHAARTFRRSLIMERPLAFAALMTKRGVGIGTAFGADPVRHLAKDSAWPPGAFGHTVGGWDVSLSDKDEQMRAVAGDATA